MPVPDYKNDKEAETFQNDSNDWVIPCRYCLKPVSSSRPPVFNSDNCSCSELGEHTQAITAAVLGGPVYQHSGSPAYVSASTQTTTDHIHQNGNMNSAADARSGHTRNDANSIQPRTGTTKYPYLLNNYLNEPEHALYTCAPPPAVHGRKRSSSMRARKGSKCGKSLRSSGSADDAAKPRFPGWEIDTFMGLGTWDSASGEGDDDLPKYALDMSGLSDAVGK
ncbi:hypothetical protein ACMFMF_007703 [Clarireedia jacksonii]